MKILLRYFTFPRVGCKINVCMDVCDAVLLWWTRVLSVYARVQLSVFGSIDVMITEFKRVK